MGLFDEVRYQYRFTEGRVTRMRRSRDRHRFKRKKWNPEEWRKADALPAAPIRWRKS